MANETMVRMGELAVSVDSGHVLIALGLGSCIGVCAYDPVARIAGMAHVVLPSSMGRSDDMPAKSADKAVPNLLEAMLKAGASQSRIKIAIAGGAQLFSFEGASTTMNVGARNITAVNELLQSTKLRVVASDVGGSNGRTVKLHVDDGIVSVRSVGKPESTLVKMS